MAAAGHDVTVFCRSAYYADRLTTYEGMRLIYLPAIKQKHLETPVAHGLQPAAPPEDMCGDLHGGWKCSTRSFV